MKNKVKIIRKTRRLDNIDSTVNSIVCKAEQNEDFSPFSYSRDIVTVVGISQTSVIERNPFEKVVRKAICAKSSIWKFNKRKDMLREFV